MPDNGERLEARLGNKAITLGVKDLLPVLVLVLAGVGGYAIWVQASQGLAVLYKQHEQLERLMQEQQMHRADYMREMVRLLSVAEYNRDRAPADRLPLVLDPQVLAPDKPIR